MFLVPVHCNHIQFGQISIIAIVTAFLCVDLLLYSMAFTRKHFFLVHIAKGQLGAQLSKSWIFFLFLIYFSDLLSQQEACISHTILSMSFLQGQEYKSLNPYIMSTISIWQVGSKLGSIISGMRKIPLPLALLRHITIANTIGYKA